ncbi:MAG: hypothetical protein ABSA79_01015 [Candidatus Bathyarchaeia archaeon]
MSENDKNEKNNEPLETKNKKVKVVTVRLTPEELAAIDKTCPVGERNQLIKHMLKEGIEKSGGQIQAPVVTYEKLEAETDQCRRKMDRIIRAMKNFQRVYDNFVTQPLTPENIPALIEELREFNDESTAQNTLGNGFSQGDVYDFIVYLKTKQKHDELCKQMRVKEKAELGKSETPTENKDAKVSTEPETLNLLRLKHVPKNRLCGCGRHELKEDHNRRCMYIMDTQHACGLRMTNQNLNTPEKLLKMINSTVWEFVTSAEEKNWIIDYLKKQGTTSQKVTVNTYFYFRLFPIPFPECDTYLFGKLVTEDLTCEKTRAVLLDPEDRDLCITQQSLNRINPDEDPERMIRMITGSKWGWMYIGKAQKEILVAYLKEHKLPFPRYKGKHVKLEFAIFNDNGSYHIPEAAQRFLDEQDKTQTEDSEPNFFDSTEENTED